MTRQIDADTLREWLDTGRPMTVLDLRTHEDRAQWAIPGGMHLNAYDALRAGEAGPLADAAIPHGQPVVTVCNAGRVSQAAADVLVRRGFDARSLAGGMNAWTLAWNTAEVAIADTSVRVIQVRRTGKRCLSYVIGSGEDAVVIDPSVSPQVYLDLVARRGWRLRHVLETHIHADHLSRARQLVERTGAGLLLPRQERVQFVYTAIEDRDQLKVGTATITALRTPGHTDESTSYVLNDAAVFSGDTLFTNGVGRPDLHADLEGARARARALFASLERLRALGPRLLILPAHASEPVPFDGEPVAAQLGDVATWLSEWLAPEATFVDRVVSRLPPTPPNFTRIVALNEGGDFAPGDPTDLEAGANRCAVA